eukprot:Awhi_evm1s3842
MFCMVSSELGNQNNRFDLNDHDISNFLHTNIFQIHEDMKNNEGKRIMYMRPNKYVPSKIPAHIIIKSLYYVLECLTADPEVAENGFIFVCDMKNWNMKNFSTEYASEFFKVVDQKFPLIITQFILVNPPKMFPMVWKMIKPMMSASFASKWLLVSGSKFSSMCDPKNIPVELGGKTISDPLDFISLRCQKENIDLVPQMINRWNINSCNSSKSSTRSLNGTVTLATPPATPLPTRRPVDYCNNSNNNNNNQREHGESSVSNILLFDKKNNIQINYDRHIDTVSNRSRRTSYTSCSSLDSLASSSFSLVSNSDSSSDLNIMMPSIETQVDNMDNNFASYNDVDVSEMDSDGSGDCNGVEHGDIEVQDSGERRFHRRPHGASVGSEDRPGYSRSSLSLVSSASSDRISTTANPSPSLLSNLINQQASQSMSESLDDSVRQDILCPLQGSISFNF